MTAEASCMSFGHFLELSFSALNLELRGPDGTDAWPLHSGFVRYFGIGPIVACFHFEHISPNVIQLPAPQISYDLEAQQRWLLGEVDELSQVRTTTTLPPPPPPGAATMGMTSALRCDLLSI